jgi:hypothetical protein
VNRIKFSHLWDKLYEPEFTTIRPWKADKERYYRNLVSEEFQIWKAGESYPFRPEYVLCQAFLEDVVTIDPRDISQELLRKDVTLDGQIQDTWIKRLMKHDMVLILKFSKPRKGQQILTAMEASEK